MDETQIKQPDGIEQIDQNGIEQIDQNGIEQIDQHDHRKTYAARLIIGAVILCVFFAMHFLYTAEISIEFDLAIGEAVRTLRAPVLTEIMIAITNLADWKVLVSVGVVLLIIDAVKWHKPDYPLAVIACLLTLGLYKLLKSIVQRPRPDQVFWLVLEHGYSFPSGHSMNGMFCYGMMVYLLWRNCTNTTIRNILTVVLCALPPLIAFSRVYCGVHHPTDVIAGLSVGFALLMFSTVIIDEIVLRIAERKRQPSTET